MSLSTGEIYNLEQKEKFLDERYPNEDSQKSVRYMFFHSFLNEKVLQKDLYDFTEEEIGKVIADSQPRSIMVARTRLSYIKQYISWSIDENLRRSNISPLVGISVDWADKFVIKNFHPYINKEQLDDILSQLENYQDAALLKLLFCGVYGFESSELRNLKWEDIDEEGNVVLHDDKKGDRPFKFDKETLKLLDNANDEARYANRNGKSISNAPWSDLLPSAYVLKNAKRSKSIPNERVTQPVIMKRIKTISEIFKLPDVTPKSIWRSGQLYLAYLSLTSTGEINYDEIGDRFNLSKVDNNGYFYYNVSYLEKNYLNKETISDLYDIVK